MKTFRAILFSFVFAASVLAEDQTVEHAKASANANQPAQQKLEAERRAKAALEKKTVTYSGFFVDLARAQKQTERKWKLFSLRQPAHQKQDAKNVHLDERTGRPKGFTLFSADF